MGLGPLGWLRTVFTTEPTNDDEQRTDGGAAEPELYECPDCGTVFIRTDAYPCANCESDVETVPKHVQ